MAKRVQSPSSINTFLQCPRKYYHTYIEELPRHATIYTARGHVAHSVLEHFFDIKTEGIRKQDAMQYFQNQIPILLARFWQENKEEFDTLNISKKDEQEYFEETLFMLYNWVDHFVQKRILSDSREDLNLIFKDHIPVREEEYKSEIHQVRGFIDAIEHRHNKIWIMDYKTSKRAHMSPAYRLQLSIYAMMYLEKHGKMPDKVGIYFLKHNPPHYLDVDENMIAHAKKMVSHVHAKTESEDKKEYPMQTSPLCNWGRGCCEYYQLCFPKKN